MKSWSIAVRFLVLGLILAFSAFFGGCFGQGSNIPPRTLRTAMQADPRTLDPAQSTSTHSGIVLALLYSNLVTFDAEGKLAYDAAKFYKISQDGLTYSFTLQDGLRFSDQRKVKASDVVYSLNRLALPATASPRAWLMEPVEGYADVRSGKSSQLSGLRAVDEKTVTIRLSQRFTPFLSYLAMPQTVILPEGESVKGEKVPAGSGPFILQHWKRDQELLLTRNPLVRLNGNLEGVWFRIIKDPFTLVTELKSGHLDLCEVPSQQLPSLQDSNNGVTLHEIEEYNVYFLGLNTRAAVMAKPQIRQAMAHAIPREKILKTLMKGQGTVATGPVPAGLKGWLKDDPWDYDPMKAARLLQESGYSGEELKLAVYNDPFSVAVCEVIRQALQEVGFKVQIVSRDWNGFTEMLVKLEYDLFYRNWVADFPDGDNFLYPLYHSDSHGLMGNYTMYSNPELDQIIGMSRMETDSIAREKLLSQGAVIARDDLSRVLLWYKKKAFAVRDSVRDYRPYPMYNSNKFLHTRLTAR